MAKNINTVELEGIVYSCAITEQKDNGIIARMEVATKPRTGKSDQQKGDYLFHRVAVAVQGEKEQQFREIEENCMNNQKNFGNDLANLSVSIINLKGTLASDKSGNLIVIAKDNDVNFPKRLRYKNKMTLEGLVSGTSSNDAYACAILEMKDRSDATINIPIIISSTDDTRKWADISSGRIKKNDIVKVTGPLISRTYSDGQRKIFRCSVNAKEFIIKGKKQTQQVSFG